MADDRWADDQRGDDRRGDDRWAEDRRASVSLAGVVFDNMTVAEAAWWIAERSADSEFSYVVTPNADHMVRLNRDARLLGVYREAGLCLLDSRVVADLGRLLGLVVPAVAPGSDLTAYLLKHHLRPGERVTIVGLSPEWLPALVERCGLAPPAHFNPPMGFERDPAAIEEAAAFVRANPARFVFLAVGSPRQEYLAAAIAEAGGACGTGLCVGASLEFLAGARRRAPVVLQHARMEWLFRLMQDPGRMFRRYVIDSPVVIALLLRQRLGRVG